MSVISKIFKLFFGFLLVLFLLALAIGKFLGWAIGAVFTTVAVVLGGIVVGLVVGIGVPLGILLGNVILVGFCIFLFLGFFWLQPWCNHMILFNRRRRKLRV